MASQSEPYSDLEVFRRENYDHGKQVAPENGKIVGRYTKYDGIEVAATQVPFSVSPNADNNNIDSSLIPLSGKNGKRGCLASLSKRRKWLIAGGITLAVIIIAAVLGGILVHVKASTHSAPHSTATGGFTSGPTQTTTRTTVSASVFQTTGPLPTRGLAAVSYPSGSSNTTHLFYQDSSGELIESISTSDNGSWTTNSLGIKANNGSALAAAVTRPDLDPMAITLFYIDPSHTLQNLIFNSSTSAWSPGKISASNISVYPFSHLAALANPCISCIYTTIVVYQDMQGFISIGNQTDIDGPWDTSKRWGEPLGVSFSLQNNTDPGIISNHANLWYQHRNGDIMTLFWQPVFGWSNHSNMPQYQTFPFRTTLAATASKQIAQSGSQLWINLLSLEDQGVRVDTWSGNAMGFLVDSGRPEVMQNVTGGGKEYGALATTEAGEIFAFVRDKESEEGIRVEGWVMDGDLVTWRDRVGVGLR
ncbi:hypothetical protein ACMFMG_012079 [Clarireedia jacksonii]